VAKASKCVDFLHLISSDNAQLYKKTLAQHQANPDIEFQRIAAWIVRKGCKQPTPNSRHLLTIHEK
jgi:uncharacterized protein with gpF-like domain